MSFASLCSWLRQHIFLLSSKQEPVSRINIRLTIVAVVALLVSLLATFCWARQTCVPTWHIKSAAEAYIPIIVSFIIIKLSGRGASPLSAPCWVLWRWYATSTILHIVCWWLGLKAYPSSTASSASSAASVSTSTYAHCLAPSLPCWNP